MNDQYDVIIAGSGVAGMYTALNLPPETRILLICKDEMMLSNTALAQGGVACVLDLYHDNYDLHFDDTIIAGGFKNNPAAVRTLVTEGPDDVLNIYRMGVDFDLNKDGTLTKTLEGGHSRHRIVHHHDSTGYEIARALSAVVRTRKNIEIAENTLLFDLDPFAGGYFASVVYNGEPRVISAPFVVLATGGIGQVYKYTTNSAIATGDGIRLAFELGCKIAHLDYVQFHPTAFAGAPGRQRFLISEAVRGEGAYLLNCNKERFMHLYDPRLELAPRDVVSKSIILESRRQASENFYLDISYKDETFLKNRFPMIYQRCLEYGIDITRQPIPVFPCQHYLMGGIDVDLHARTGADRLYAVGECSHTGVHGGNRLASNSLLEALVFGRRAAADITARAGTFSPPHAPRPRDISGAPVPAGIDAQINDILQESCFVMPDLAAIPKGLRQVTDLLDRLYTGGFAINRSYCEALSLATVAHIILKEMEKR